MKAITLLTALLPLTAVADFERSDITFGELVSDGYRVVGYAVSNEQENDKTASRSRSTEYYILQHPEHNDVYQCVLSIWATALPSGEVNSGRSFDCSRAGG